MVEREQPPLPASDPPSLAGLHRRGADLRPRREPLPRHHRDLQGA